jgi:hypothetical protein
MENSVLSRQARTLVELHSRAEPKPLSAEEGDELLRRLLPCLPFCWWQNRRLAHKFEADYFQERWAYWVETETYWYRIEKTTVYEGVAALDLPIFSGEDAVTPPREPPPASKEALIEGTDEEKVCPDCWGECTNDENTGPCEFCAGTGKVRRRQKAIVTTWTTEEKMGLGTKGGPIPVGDAPGLLLGEITVDVDGNSEITTVSPADGPAFPLDALVAACSEGFAKLRQRMSAVTHEVPFAQTVRLFRLRVLDAFVRLPGGRGRWVTVLPERERALCLDIPAAPWLRPLGFVLGLFVVWVFYRAGLPLL